jgi:hypothetical protein
MKKRVYAAWAGFAILYGAAFFVMFFGPAWWSRAAWVMAGAGSLLLMYATFASSCAEVAEQSKRFDDERAEVATKLRYLFSRRV